MNRVLAGATWFCGAVVAFASPSAAGEQPKATATQRVRRAMTETLRANRGALPTTRPAGDLKTMARQLAGAKLPAARTASGVSPSARPAAAPTTQPAVAKAAGTGKAPAPAKAKPPATVKPKPTAASSRPAPASKPAMDPALEKIRNLPPTKVCDPLSLADTLYLAGRPTLAYDFYKKVMDGEKDPTTRAWVLFQLGNCARSTRPALALGYYQQLASDHGDSHWRPVADAMAGVLTWNITYKPGELLKKAARTAGAE